MQNRDSNIEFIARLTDAINQVAACGQNYIKASQGQNSDLGSLSFYVEMKRDKAKKKLDEAINTFDQLLQEAAENDYDINVHNKGSITPFHQVIGSCRNDLNDRVMLDLLKKLHAKGADINKVSCDSKMYSPLHTAARRCLVQIIPWLFEVNVDFSVLDSAYKCAIDYIEQTVDTKKVKNKQDNKSETKNDESPIVQRLEETLAMLTELQAVAIRRIKLGAQKY